MLNLQNLSYQLFIDKIPISKLLKKLIKNKKIKKSKLISNGDDIRYYLLLIKKNLESYLKHQKF